MNSSIGDVYSASRRPKAFEIYLTGFLTCGLYGLYQACAFLLDPASHLVAVSWHPLISVIIVGLHGFFGALVFSALAIPVSAIFPLRCCLSLSCLGALAAAAIWGIEQAAHAASEASLSLIGLGLRGLLGALVAGLIVGLSGAKIQELSQRFSVLRTILWSGMTLVSMGLAISSAGGAPSWQGGAFLLAVSVSVIGFLMTRVSFLVAKDRSAAKNTHRFLVGVFVLVGLVFATLGWFESSPLGNQKSVSSIERDKPNILLISVDTWRADAASFAGSDQVDTPHFDALAERGLTFSQTFTSAPWTLPSMASLFTSRYPTECGTGRDGRENGPILERYLERAQIDPSLPTLPTLLQDEGYSTSAIVSNVWLREGLGFGRGFDSFLDLTKDAPHRAFESLRAYRIARRFVDVLQVDRTDGQEVTRQAHSELERLKDQSFFLWVHYMDPHLPYQAPGAEHSTPMILDDLRSGRYVSSEQREPIFSSYLSEVEYADAQVGKLLEQLVTLGLEDDTIVVLLSDHGEEFWEHGGFEHGHTLHREVTQVPLVIVPQKGGLSVPRGTRQESMTSLLDVLPSILDLASIPVPGDLRGQSLFAQDRESRPLFHEALLYGDERHGLRSEDRFLVRDVLTQTWSEFDLNEDPFELSPVVKTSTDPGQEESPEEWSRVLGQWSESMLKLNAQQDRGGGAEPDEATLEALRKLGYAR